MSDTINKQALLEWLKEQRLKQERNRDRLEVDHQYWEFHEGAATYLKAAIEAIESGCFDSPSDDRLRTAIVRELDEARKVYLKQSENMKLSDRDRIFYEGAWAAMRRMSIVLYDIKANGDASEIDWIEYLKGKEQAEIDRMRTALASLPDKIMNIDSIAGDTLNFPLDKPTHEEQSEWFDEFCGRMKEHMGAVIEEALSTNTEPIGAERVREIWDEMKQQDGFYGMNAVEKTLNALGIIIPGINSKEE